MSLVYNPGCALLIYKEHLALKIFDFLKKENDITLHTTRCHHDPQLEMDSTIINTCAGCDKRFTNLYDDINTFSIWEYLASSETFDFPDHSGLTLSIHDPCPIRNKLQVHEAIRTVLTKMNIKVIEAQHIKDKSICCGDSLYPKASLEVISKSMINRAQSMPCDEVCVYCVSCIKSMHNGGKKPRYLVDLLFNEDTEIQENNITKWHDEINEFIKKH